MLLLADLVISAIRLAEAEVHAFRRGIVRVAVAFLMFLAALVFLLIALGMALAGFFLLLLPAVGPVWAAFIVAAATLIVAGILAVIGRKYAK